MHPVPEYLFFTRLSDKLYNFFIIKKNQSKSVKMNIVATNQK